MTDFINYNQILDDVKAMLTTAVGVQADTSGKFTTIDRNIDPTQFSYAAMPLADVRMSGARPGVRAGQQYYTPVSVEIEIAAFDLRDQDKAATIVLDLTNKVQRAFVENPHYGAVWDSIEVSDVNFFTAYDRSPEKSAFVATAVAQFVINVYSQ